MIFPKFQPGPSLLLHGFCGPSFPWAVIFECTVSVPMVPALGSPCWISFFKLQARQAVAALGHCYLSYFIGAAVLTYQNQIQYWQQSCSRYIPRIPFLGKCTSLVAQTTCFGFPFILPSLSFLTSGSPQVLLHFLHYFLSSLLLSPPATSHIFISCFDYGGDFLLAAVSTCPW